MRIQTAEAFNFMPFKSAKVNFDLPGLTMIEGIIQGAVGSDSNGSGKSAILDLVSWVVYDRCLRERYTGDDIIRTGTKGSEGTFGTVTIKDGKTIIKITRYRKHPIRRNEADLEIDGKQVSRGTTPETNALIERTLGIDFSAFTNSVAFGAREDVRSFFAATDSDRKRILDTLIGLEQYTEAEKVARRRLKLVLTDLEVINGNLIRAEATRDALAAQQSDETDQKSPADLELEIKAEIERLEDAKKRKVKDDAALAKAKKAQADARTAYNDKKAKFEVDRAAHAQTLQDLNMQYNKLSNQIASKSSDARSLMSRVNNMRGLKAVCPTCDQKISPNYVEEFSAPILADIKKIDEEVAKLRKDETAAKDEKEKHAKNIPVAPSIDALNTATAQVTLAQSTASDAAHEVEMSQAQIDGLNAERENLKNRADQLQAQIKAAKDEVSQFEIDKAAHQEKADRLQFWVEGFGNSGLKSFLFELAIPEINRRATTLASRLLGDGAYVRLSATTTLKSKDAVKEKLSIESFLPGKTKTFAGASKGQKKRFDLCLLLAFREMAMSKSAKCIDQLFADELFDGLDRTGSAAVVSLLREYAAKSPVILVTHDDRLKSSGDRIIQVIHDGTSATVVCEEQTPAPTETPKPVIRRRATPYVDKVSKA